MNKILVIGATSTIAKTTLRLLVTENTDFFLVARDKEKLAISADDLSVRGANSVRTFSTDLSQLDDHPQLIDEAVKHLGTLDLVLVAHGTLGDQALCEQSVEMTLDEIKTNALSTVALLTQLANVLEAQRSGTLAVISSVAGDRGRKSNYVYGASKAMVSTFLQGLRNRLHNRGVHVLTVKPGLVDTVMTEDFPKGPLWAKPEDVARGIVRAIRKKKDIAYLPFFWRYIMLAITCIPESLFKRMSL